MKKKDIEILQLKTNTFQATLSKESVETREMHSAIASLTSQRDTQLATRDALLSQIAATQKDIETRTAAQRARATHLEAQARYNVPELDFWVTNLCLRIEGAGQDDRLRFVYTYVDERDWEREAWFELSTATRDYDVRHCRPKLEKGRVDKVLERVNETRELSVLLKGMRELFVEAMKC
jgi:kinetochore protein Spc25, fungi type